MAISALPFTVAAPSTSTRTRDKADKSQRNLVVVGRDKGGGQRVEVPIALALSVRSTFAHALNLLNAIIERGGNARHRIVSDWPAPKGRNRYGGIGRSAEAEKAGYGYTYLYPEFSFDSTPVYLSGSGETFKCGDRAITGFDLLENLWLDGYTYEDGDGNRVYINGLSDFIGVINASLPGLGLKVTAGDNEIALSFAKEFKKGEAFMLARCEALRGMLAADAHPAVVEWVRGMGDALVDAINAKAAGVTAPATEAAPGEATEAAPGEATEAAPGEATEAAPGEASENGESEPSER